MSRYVSHVRTPDGALHARDGRFDSALSYTDEAGVRRFQWLRNHADAVALVRRLNREGARDLRILDPIVTLRKEPTP